MKTLSIMCSTLLLAVFFAPAWAGQEAGARKLAVAKAVLGNAKITFADALAIAQKRVPEGKPLVARAESEGNTSKFGFYFLVGEVVTEVEVDVTTGKVVKFEIRKDYATEKKLADARRSLEGATVSFHKAMEIAMAKVKDGKVFEVEMEFDGDRPIVEVEFLVGDKITRVRIDAKDETKVQVVN